MDSFICVMQLQIMKVVISNFIIEDEMQNLQESTVMILSFFLPLNDYIESPIYDLYWT